MSYVDSVWILSKVFVVRVVILDGIGVISGQFPSFQSLFQLSHPHGGNGQIAQKEQHNKAERRKEENFLGRLLFWAKRPYLSQRSGWPLPHICSALFPNTSLAQHIRVIGVYY